MNIFAEFLTVVCLVSLLFIVVYNPKDDVDYSKPSTKQERIESIKRNFRGFPDDMVISTRDGSNGLTVKEGIRRIENGKQWWEYDMERKQK